MSITMLTTTGVLSSDYIPLVKRGNSDFKTKFDPNSPDATIENGVITLFSFIGPAENGLTHWRVFVPPGTKTLQMTMYTYASPPENFIAMKLESPPSINSVAEIKYTNNGSEDKVLQNLMDGAELIFTSPAGSGGTKLSNLSNVDYKSPKGGWLYINALQIPGAKVFKLESFITVDESCYRSWYSTASFDDYGNPFEFITHTCNGGETPIVNTSDTKVITVITPPVPIINTPIETTKTDWINVGVMTINDGKLVNLDLQVTPTSYYNNPHTTFWVAATVGDSWFLNVPDLGWQSWNSNDKEFLLSSAYTSFESWSATRHINVPLFVSKPDLDALLNQGVKVYLVFSPTMEKHQRNTIDLNSPSTIKILGQ